MNFKTLIWLIVFSIALAFAYFIALPVFRFLWCLDFFEGVGWAIFKAAISVLVIWRGIVLYKVFKAFYSDDI